MSSRYRKGAASGMNALGRRKAADSNSYALSSKKHFVNQRKVIKSYRRTTWRGRQVPSNHGSGDLTSEQEEADGEGDGALGTSDDSEDDANEPRAFAPSGASRSGNLLRSRPNKLDLKRSLTKGDVKRQTGRTGRKDRKKTRFLDQATHQASLEEIFEFSEFQELHFELFAHDGTFTHDTEFAMDELDPSSDDMDDAGAVSDDEVYEQLRYMDDSDDDEDETKLEKLEEEAIARELQDSGELTEFFMMFGDGDSMFPQDLDFMPPALDYGSSIGDSEFWEMARSEATTSIQQKPVIEKSGSILELLQNPHSSSNGSRVTTSFDSTGMSAEIDNISDMDPKYTGLLTPSSAKMPTECIDGDDTDTDWDVPFPNYAVAPSTLKKKHHFATPSRTYGGIKKSSKRKTPKMGGWSISKEDICMSHGDDGELLTQDKNEQKRRSGATTPGEGIVPFDPLSSPSIDSRPVTFPVLDLESSEGLESAPLRSPTLCNSSDRTERPSITSDDLLSASPFDESGTESNQIRPRESAFESIENLLHMP